MIRMKQLFRTFLIFLILALAVEAGILICTKVAGWNNFESGRPFLAAVHVHLMAMGALFFLIQMILEKIFCLSENRWYKIFYILYLTGISIAVALMLYKGFAQIFEFSVIRGLTEGGAAIGHTAAFVGLFFFARSLYERAVKTDL